MNPVFDDGFIDEDEDVLLMGNTSQPSINVTQQNFAYGQGQGQGTSELIDFGGTNNSSSTAAGGYNRHT